MEGQYTSPSAWTAEQDAILRENWSKITTAALGLLVGKTKNSVISRAHRTGLPSYGTKLQNLKRSIETRRNIRKKLQTKHAIFRVPPSKLDKVNPLEGTGIPNYGAKRHIEPINGVGVLIQNLQKDHCRWMMDDDVHFCGHQTAHGSSYCTDHYGMVYRPAKGFNHRRWK